MSEGFEKLIITAASEAYAPSLLGLLGSLNLNWPNHPPVLVYDIGLSESTLTVLQKHGVAVKKVPPFCPHWREHFTWKLWCLNDAPAENIFWLDAGVVILRPMNEVFEVLDRIGYFVIPNYQPLETEASLAACQGCRVSPELRAGKSTLAGGIIGFRKTGEVLAILQEAFWVSLNEDAIKATEPAHRHDQAIISVLMYKYIDPLIVADGILYQGWLSPLQSPGQKIWVHHRSMNAEDLEHFTAHISALGEPYMPAPLPPPEPYKPKSLVNQFFIALFTKPLTVPAKVWRVLCSTAKTSRSRTIINEGVRD
jgi:hypothetical protein